MPSKCTRMPFKPLHTVVSLKSLQRDENGKRNVSKRSEHKRVQCAEKRTIDDEEKEKLVKERESERETKMGP